MKTQKEIRQVQMQIRLGKTTLEGKQVKLRTAGHLLIFRAHSGYLTGPRLMFADTFKLHTSYSSFYFIFQNY